MSGREILLHCRCGGCQKLFQKNVPVPLGDEVPMDGDELIESAFIRELLFRCPRCEATFAQIVAFKVLDGEAPIEASGLSSFAQEPEFRPPHRYPPNRHA